MPEALPQQGSTFCRETPKGKKVVDDYLADMDLPSSESEGEEMQVKHHAQEKKEIIRSTQVGCFLLCVETLEVAHRATTLLLFSFAYFYCSASSTKQTSLQQIVSVFCVLSFQ